MINLVYGNNRLTCSAVTSFVAVFVLGKFTVTDSPVLLHRLSTSAKDTKEQRQLSTDLDKGVTTQGNKQYCQERMSAALQKAKKEALWGMCVADALSMPVHWYYNPSDIKSGYGGWLTGYAAPAKHHPSSILTISHTGGSGRSGWSKKSKPVIGDIILHDKLKYWTSGSSSTHYHQGMKAGDNTLNSIMALQEMKTMLQVDPQVIKDDREVRGSVLEEYVQFMTTPGTHNDTYAESFHRSFFKDWAEEEKQPKTAEDLLAWVEKRYLIKSKGSSDSQLVVIGSLVPAIPWIIRNAHKSESECAKGAIEFIKLTHPEPSLLPYIDIYARLLHSVLNGHDLSKEILKCLSHSELGGPRKRDMVLSLHEKCKSYSKGSDERLKCYQAATMRLGSACYIEGALSSLLFLAMEFADDFEGGVQTNANCGGENCHRGAALGALLAAAAANRGSEVPQKFKDGLNSSKKDLLKIMTDMSQL